MNCLLVKYVATVLHLALAVFALAYLPLPAILTIAIAALCAPRVHQ